MRRILLLLGLLVPLTCFSQTYESKGAFLSFKDYPPAAEKHLWGYKNYMVSLKVSPLRIEGQNSQEIYRLLYCPTFDPALLVTIKRQGNILTVESKQSGSMGGYGATGSAFETRRNLSLKEWRKFNELFEKTDFWTVRKNIERRVLDGADYVLEAIEDGKYRYVCRDTPYGFDEDKALSDLFDWITELVPQKGILETDCGGLVTGSSGVILNSGKPATTSSKR